MTSYHTHSQVLSLLPSSLLLQDQVLSSVDLQAEIPPALWHKIGEMVLRPGHLSHTGFVLPPRTQLALWVWEPL